MNTSVRIETALASGVYWSKRGRKRHARTRWSKSISAMPDAKETETTIHQNCGTEPKSRGRGNVYRMHTIASNICTETLASQARKQKQVT